MQWPGYVPQVSSEASFITGKSLGMDYRVIVEGASQLCLMFCFLFDVICSFTFCSWITGFLTIVSLLNCFRHLVSWDNILFPLIFSSSSSSSCILPNFQGNQDQSFGSQSKRTRMTHASALGYKLTIECFEFSLAGWLLGIVQLQDYKVKAPNCLLMVDMHLFWYTILTDKVFFRRLEQERLRVWL